MKINLFFLIILTTLHSFSQSPPNRRKTSSFNEDVQRGDVKDKNDLNIEVFGSGGFQGAATESSNQSNLGSGAIGVLLYNTKVQASISFTLNSTSTVNFSNIQSFGSSLLVPGVGTNTFIADVKGFSAFNQKLLGYSIYAFASNTKWEKDGTIYNSNPIALKALVSFVPINNYGNNSTNHVMLSIEGGYTGRYLIGDITQNKTFLMETFGTEKTVFQGAEFDINLWINDTKLFVNIPIIGGGSVKGLTGGQLVIGVTLSGKLFTSKL